MGFLGLGDKGWIGIGIGAATGAASGALMGSAGGPIGVVAGAAIGAGLGATQGGLQGAAVDKAEDQADAQAEQLEADGEKQKHLANYQAAQAMEAAAGGIAVNAAHDFLARRELADKEQMKKKYTPYTTGAQGTQGGSANRHDDVRQAFVGLRRERGYGKTVG